MLDLTPDELLTTTRAVRRRLDLERPLPAELIRECVAAARLAARARGLGTSWTTVHLMMEQQVADVAGIPFEQVQQVCLTPVAFTVGTEFKPAMRPDSESVIHWDKW